MKATGAMAADKLAALNQLRSGILTYRSAIFSVTNFVSDHSDKHLETRMIATKHEPPDLVIHEMVIKHRGFIRYCDLGLHIGGSIDGFQGVSEINSLDVQIPFENFTQQQLYSVTLAEYSANAEEERYKLTHKTSIFTRDTISKGTLNREVIPVELRAIEVIHIDVQNFIPILYKVCNLLAEHYETLEHCGDVKRVHENYANGRFTI